MRQLRIDEFAARVVASLGLEEYGDISPDDDLFGLIGLDSLQAFQLIIVVEVLAGIDVPPLDLPAMFTLRDAYQYYCQLLNIVG